MKKRITIIIALFFVITVFSYSRSLFQDILSKRPIFKKNEIIKLKEIVSIGSDNIYDKDNYFGAITDFRVDDKNNIYVLDQKDFNIKIFNSKGSIIRNIQLTKGQGPGEYLRPRCMEVNEENIFIGDLNSMRISILDLNGKYIKSIHTKIQPAELQVSSGRLFITGYFDHSPERIHVYDMGKGEKINSFANANNMTNEVAEFGEKDSIYIRNNMMYFSSFFPYDIRIYSLEGKILKKISRIEHLFENKLERDKNTNALRFTIGTSRIIATEEGDIINILKCRDIQKHTLSSIIDFYDKKGEWLTTLSANDFGEDSIRYADVNRNNMLVIDTSTTNIGIRVFSIEFDRKKI